MIRFKDLYPIIDKSNLFITDEHCAVLANLNVSLGLETYHTERDKARSLVAEDKYLVAKIVHCSSNDPFIALELVKEDA